ncbi:MAG TPA: AraC family transcriptional regulator [Rudaea sp.]|nr:AraC family transcriptional regulator [Rudaea sp.]
MQPRISTLMADFGTAENVPNGARVRARPLEFGLRVTTLAAGERFEASRLLASSREQHVMLFHCGPGSLLSVGGGLCGLLSPLRGKLSVCDGGSQVLLQDKVVYVSDTNRPYELAVPHGGRAIALVAAQAVWLGILGDTGLSGGTVLFPAVHDVGTPGRRALVACLRESLGRDAAARKAQILSRLSAFVHGLQRGYDDYIERCPGRTLARRRNAFLRLQRARLHIALNNGKHIDVSTLANIANYSMWQFIKLFRRVFGVTPYAFLSNYRVDVAKSLLASENLSVADVAAFAGFASRSAFARTMKKTTGNTATALRVANLRGG